MRKTAAVTRGGLTAARQDMAGTRRPDPKRDAASQGPGGTGGVTAYIALGGNLGDVLATFRAVLGALTARGVEVLTVSSAYRTKPLVAPGTVSPVPDYWNAACAVRTRLAPGPLLELLRSIEAELGRVRRERWASRPIDLDLLLYDDARIDEPELQVPHPAMADRAFVLKPLAEIASERAVPGRAATVRELLGRLPDPDEGILERRARWR
jgi:2-amino-4-hydroxy-6-hydroxymethyldihydropteridine diphosphokinase